MHLLTLLLVMMLLNVLQVQTWVVALVSVPHEDVVDVSAMEEYVIIL